MTEYHHSHQEGFIQSFWATLTLIFRDKAMILMLVLAPILYGFYYPWPYSTQRVEKVPVGVVDYDHSAISRQIVRYASASPSLQPHYYPNTHEAYQALLNGDIGAYFVLPHDLTHRLYYLNNITIPINANGAYLLIGKSALTGILSTLGTLSAGIEYKRDAIAGLSQQQSEFLRDPTPIILNLKYNPNEGYGNYVVPAVAWLILQQTLLIGAALFIGTLFEKKQVHATASGWAGRILALAIINMIMAWFYTGFVFRHQGYAYGGNPLGNALLILLFSPTVATLGCLLGLWFKERERALQILTFSSLPLYFLSGFSWPLSALPEPLHWLRWLTPSTSAIQAGVHFNQMNAPITANGQYLIALLILGLGSFYLLLHLKQARYIQSSER